MPRLPADDVDRSPATRLARLPRTVLAPNRGAGSLPAGVSPGLVGTRSADPRPVAIAPDSDSGDRGRQGAGQFPVQRGDERADEPCVAAEVPQPPGARSRTEVHPRLRLRVERDADHHVAPTAGNVPPRKGLDDAFLLVPPAGMPARQFASYQVECAIPHTRERDGIGAAHETPVDGVGRRPGGSLRKRALEAIGKRDFLAQPFPPGRPGSRNRGDSQRIILRWRAHEFHSARQCHGIRQTSHRTDA